VVYSIILLILGFTIGGYLLNKVQPRSFLAVNMCQESCYKLNDMVGLVAAIGMQNIPDLIPYRILETDKTLVIKYPLPDSSYPTHLVAIPKRDIKNPADLTDLDKEYLSDAYAAMGQIVRERNLTNYKIITNGPGFQTVTYLHFHLVAKES